MNNTTENNKLIAEFMGLPIQLHMVEHPVTGEYVDFEDFDYYNDWNSLMEVVEKIHRTKLASIEIHSNSTKIGFNHNTKIFAGSFSDCFDNTYKAVIEFIKWYNENK